jgi:CheY-like chemotaxis protein/anti-sigma regulatory factor (Ser/Thr protein kinase)
MSKEENSIASLKQKQEVGSSFTAIVPDHVLVVDDDPLILAMLENTLQRDGYKVLSAKNGKEALDYVHNKPVAVLICDINLPDINGIEICKKVKHTHPDIERLLITGMKDLSGLENDFAREEITIVIPKPWEEIVLRHTVRLAWKKHQISKEHFLLKEWIESLRGPLPPLQGYIPKNILFGKRVQEHVLIAKNDPTLSGLEIEKLFLPLENAYTDFFEFYYPCQNYFDVMMGNVKEKGIAAALIGTMLKERIAHYHHPLLKAETYEKKEGWQESLMPLEGILEFLEESIGEQLYKLNGLAALSIARFNLASRTLSYIKCGDFKGFLWKAGSNKIIPLLDSQFPLLGMQNHTQWHVLEISYEIGDLFIFYSPGLPGHAEKYLFEWLATHSEMDPKILVSELKERISEGEMETDVTLIALKVNLQESTLSTRFLSATFRSSIDELDQVRNYVQKLCLHVPGNQQKLIHHLQLVINEVFCNIVEHGYSNNPKGIIVIKGIQESQGISLDVFDQGDAYVPSEIPEPILTGEMDRGFGLHIIKELVDQITYTCKSTKTGWNHLHIFKKFCEGEETCR